MGLTARTRSLLFSGTLIGVCLAAFVGASVTVNGILAPFVSGEDWAHERALARGTSALAVHVGEYGEGSLSRIAGATVTVWRLLPEGEALAARAKTPADGRVVFELRQGPYLVEVAHAGRSDSEAVQLDGSTRLGAYRLSSGETVWRRIPHAVLEERGDVATLDVAVTDRTLCRPEGDGEFCPSLPAPGARIEVRTGGKLVASASTVDRTSFVLPIGAYALTVEQGARSATLDLALLCDEGVRADLDRDGVTFERACARGAAGVVAP